MNFPLFSCYFGLSLRAVMTSSVLMLGGIHLSADEVPLFETSENGLLSIVHEGYFNSLNPYSAEEALATLPLVHSFERYPSNGGTLRGAGFSDYTTDGAYLGHIGTDSIHLDYFEILRGPDSIGAGYWGLGQVINAVTKRPDDSGDFVRAQLMSGRGGKVRGTIDYNTDLSPSSSETYFGFRLTGAYAITDLEGAAVVGDKDDPSSSDFLDFNREDYASWAVFESGAYEIEQSSRSKNQHSFAPSILFQSEGTSLLLKHTTSENGTDRIGVDLASIFNGVEDDLQNDLTLFELKQRLWDGLIVKISNTWANYERDQFSVFVPENSFSEVDPYTTDNSAAILEKHESTHNSFRVSLEYDFELWEHRHRISAGNAYDSFRSDNLDKRIHYKPIEFFEGSDSYVPVGPYSEGSLYALTYAADSDANTSYVAYESSFFGGKIDFKTSVQFDEMDSGSSVLTDYFEYDGSSDIVEWGRSSSNDRDFDDWGGEFALSYHFTDSFSGYTMFSQTQKLEPIREMMQSVRAYGSDTLDDTDYCEVGVSLDADVWGKGSLSFFQNKAHDFYGDPVVGDQNYKDFEGIEITWQASPIDQLDLLWSTSYSASKEKDIRGGSPIQLPGRSPIPNTIRSNYRSFRSSLWFKYVLEEGFLEGAEIGGLFTYVEYGLKRSGHSNMWNTLDLYVSCPVALPWVREGRVFMNGYNVAKHEAGSRSWLAGIEVGF